MTVGTPVGTVTTWSFDATGAAQTVVIPAHDGPVRIRARGGRGANGSAFPSGAVGEGGPVEAWAAITAGSTVAAFPGDGGVAGGAEPAAFAGGKGTGAPGVYSGTGGAATTVHVDGTLIIVAGGGGGAGAGTYGRDGGSGGDGVSTDGGDGDGGASGRGGTGASGGAGGTGHDMGGGATAGGAGVGHIGGDAVSDWLVTGGGGGGWYGGGGGAVRLWALDGEIALGGGGGGSTWVHASLTDVTSTGPDSAQVEITADVLPWRPRAHLGLVAATR